MKAEHRHHLEQNALVERVGHLVQGVKSAPATQSLALWVGVLAVIIVIIAWQFFRNASYTENSFLWRQFDSATREPDDALKTLESLRDDHPGSNVGTSAGYQLARLKFFNGQANLGNSVSYDRKEAIKNLVDARGLYVQLAKDSSDAPLLMQESMMMQAKIDESLTGVPNPEKPTEMLGSLDKAKEAYQSLAAKFPDSAAGIAASKRLEDLNKNKAQIESFYTKFNELMAAPAPSGPIDTNPVPVFPNMNLPKLPAGYENPEAKPSDKPAPAKPGETKPSDKPALAKPGESKPPESSAPPAKSGDGKPTSNPATSPTKTPAIPITPPAGKPGDTAAPATKAPETTAPKAGDTKSPPASAPDKKQ